ncbi:RHS repeat domain-containing protein [Variovorax sp. Varisp85]|uniref:RHS repeat domain-containing protein n=1 Tax=Variovorax sp. Varisp85 TaxID=3243059 RepID=UPI0039A6DF7E
MHYIQEPGSFVPLLQIRQAQAVALSQTTDVKALIAANGGRYDIEQDPLWNGAQLNTPAPFAKEEIAFYQCDHLGTPQELTDHEGRIAWSASYKAWGEAKQAISEAGRKAGFRNPIRFQGQYFDDETGLHYNRYRYYDPVSGRFVSSDPIGLLGGTNLHAAVPNPTGWIDSNGLSPAEILKKVAQVKAGRSVTVCSFKEASTVLFAAFPDAQKSAGAGDKDPAKTARDKAAFKSNRQNGTGRASYHMDFKTNPATGVLYGHESLPNGHPHKTMPHINVITPEGDRLDIFVDRPTKCPSAKKK